MKRKRFRERTLLPRAENYGLKKNVVKIHWVTKIHRQLNPDLARKLHKIYLDHQHSRFEDTPKLNEFFSKNLLHKYLNMITIFREGLFDLTILDQKFSDAIKSEDQKSAENLANSIETSILTWFNEMLRWCEEHDTWALLAAGRLTAPITIGGFMQHIKKAHRGDRPIEMTREQHQEEVKKLKGAKSVGEMFKKRNDKA